MRRMLRLLNLIALLGFEAGGIVILHRLGRLEWLRIEWSDLNAWLETTAPEDALAAVIRLIALAIAYWVAGTTALYVLARLLHVPAALRAAEWATMPAVRRIVDGAVALSVATVSIAGPVAPAIAQTPEPVVITVDNAGRPVPPGVPDGDEDTTDEAPDSDDGGRVSVVTPGLDRIGWTPQPAGVTAPGASTMSGAVDSLRDAVATQVPEAAADGFAQVTVVRGDHLWSLSERHLTDAGGDTPTDAEIARYWRRVSDTNRDRLRSGDPDLIYPGETVRLPPIDLEDEQP